MSPAACWRARRVSRAVPAMVIFFSSSPALGRGGRGDVTAKRVADGGVAELGERGQGGVPADRVPGARLGLVPAGHVLSGLERFLAGASAARRPCRIHWNSKVATTGAWSDSGYWRSVAKARDSS